VSSEGLTGLRLTGLLKRAQAQLVGGLGPALAPFGIDGRELAVLTALAAHGPVSQQEISQALTIDRTTMVALVDGLTAKGLVARKPDPSDRRKNLVEATAQGRSIAERAGPAVDEVERRFLEPVAAADRAALLRILRELTG
jgi:DNA-binding MarR family transcriptional regulator